LAWPSKLKRVDFGLSKITEWFKTTVLRYLMRCNHVVVKNWVMAHVSATADFSRQRYFAHTSAR